jgi:hypothetical protein
MFTLKDFIKKGLLNAVGKMADYQIILNAAGWLEKGVLTEDDLMEINSAIEAQYPALPPEATVTETEAENENIS